MSEGAWYRKGVEALRRIDPHLRDRARAAGNPRSLVRRALVQNVVPSGTRVIWVVSGRVRLSAFDAEGAETILAVLEPGSCFWLGARRDDVVRATAEALEATEIVAFDASALAAHPEIAALFPGVTEAA